jgi:serine/threonine-protein kinase HipA
MRQLFVWVKGRDGLLRLAGELATTEPAVSNGHFESEFAYLTEWVRDPASFSLDPVSLPLAEGRRFRAELFYPPLAIFDDSLPDDWGRRLLSAALKIEGRKPTMPEMLLRMRGGGTGALLFTEHPVASEPDVTVQSTALPALLDAAARFEAGTLSMHDEFRKLLQGSSRAGGARPKALVHDDQGEWIAKFPDKARDYGHDVVGLEAVCLEIARRAGLLVPESRLVSVGRRRVLLVKRFDVTESGGRIHMVSMRSLCRERPGIHVQGYSDLVPILRKHSAAPAADVAMLFRHMVLNAAIGNVDDHLKNFWMLATPAGYRLAPAFDLVPDITGRGEHTLMFQYSFACPARADLLTIGDAWNVSNAADIIDQVVSAATGFATIGRGLKVQNSRNLQNLDKNIRERGELISSAVRWKGHA